MAVRLFFLLLYCCISLPGFSQADTNYLKNIYTRCMDFSEEKIDSLDYYSDYISTLSVRLNFPTGNYFALRVKGLREEFKSDYSKASDYYLQALEQARKLKRKDYEAAELVDLAIVYTEMKEYVQAKEVYLQSLAVSNAYDTANMIQKFTNLGALYNYLKMHDSALVFLKKGLSVLEVFTHPRPEDVSTLYNNLGNTYFFKKQYDVALSYFFRNYVSHQKPDQMADLWIDCLNIADNYIEMGHYDSARKYVDMSLAMARELHAKSKEAESYSIEAKLYQRKGDYTKAYDYQQKWYDLDTSMVNSETTRKVAQLQEQYHARQRENEKLLLQTEVDKQVFRSRTALVTSIALLLILIVIAWGFITKRNANRELQSTNKLIMEQNEKLAELNFEKNALISIVSHDLGTPFASIGMWSQVLGADAGQLNEEQHKAVKRIREATLYGENLIRRILDVEKAQTNRSRLNLENIELNGCIGSVSDTFRHLAQKKDILLEVVLPDHPVYLLSDHNLLSRICENLLSNAIKFTHRGKKVALEVLEQPAEISIIVRDEGVGIKKEELPYLFSKYGKISSYSTEGEPSTGLGLAIVKRIVEELNGTIQCESEEGRGSVFTVIFSK